MDWLVAGSGRFGGSPERQQSDTLVSERSAVRSQTGTDREMSELMLFGCRARLVGWW